MCHHIMKWITYLPLLALAGLLGCTPYFLSSRFEDVTAGHRVIAVLPFEMHFTGVIPERLTEQDVRDVEEAESKAFQISFYHELLRSTRAGRRAIRVDIQDYHQTLSILEREGIGIRDSWDLPPDRLAGLLKVDAVVRARIDKARLMSDLASYGIEVGVHILNRLTRYGLWPWLPPFSNQSKEITGNYSLFDMQEGITLWSIGFDEGADWRKPANEIIDQINRKAAKKFPYRQ